MAAYGSIYNTLFRRNYAMLTIVFGSAFFFQMGYDTTLNTVWDKVNRGRQWKDIRAKYIEGGEDDEE